MTGIRLDNTVAAIAAELPGAAELFRGQAGAEINVGFFNGFPDLLIGTGQGETRPELGPALAEELLGKASIQGHRHGGVGQD